MTVALFASVAALVAAVVLARWLWELDRLESRQREQAAQVAARRAPAADRHACMVDDTDPFGLDRPPSPIDMAVAGVIIAVFLLAVALVALEFVRVVLP